MEWIRVGTSGWSYREWCPIFYQPKLPQAAWLERYARAFATVEVNATFYRLPTLETVERWREMVPSGFKFSCKGSRYLSHRRRLLEVETGLERFFAPLVGFREKLGPVLWQLPPNWKRPDPKRLANFIAHLPRDHRHVFEFRSEGWYVDEIFDILDRYGVAICEHDLLARRPPRLTGSFRYLRFHGSHYGGRYGEAALRGVAEELLSWPGEVWVYFNNDREGAALFDALDLSKLLGSRLFVAGADQLAWEMGSGASGPPS